MIIEERLTLLYRPLIKKERTKEGKKEREKERKKERMNELDNQ